jgi:hypothetical protein
MVTPFCHGQPLKSRFGGNVYLGVDCIPGLYLFLGVFHVGDFVAAVRNLQMNTNVSLV